MDSKMNSESCEEEQTLINRSEVISVRQQEMMKQKTFESLHP